MTFQPSTRRPVRIPDARPMIIAIASAAFGAAVTLGVVAAWPASSGSANADLPPSPFVTNGTNEALGGPSLGGPVVRGLLDADGTTLNVAVESAATGASLGGPVVRGLRDADGSVLNVAVESSGTGPSLGGRVVRGLLDADGTDLRPAPFVTNGTSEALGGPVVRGMLDADGAVLTVLAESTATGASLGRPVIRGLLDADGTALDVATPGSATTAVLADRVYPPSREGQRGHITTD